MSQIKKSTVNELVSLIEEAIASECRIKSLMQNLEKLKIKVESIGLSHDRSLNFDTVKGLAAQAANSGDAYFNKQDSFGPCSIISDIPALQVVGADIEESLLSKLLKK